MNFVVVPCGQISKRLWPQGLLSTAMLKRNHTIQHHSETLDARQRRFRPASGLHMGKKLRELRTHLRRNGKHDLGFGPVRQGREFVAVSRQDRMPIPD